MFLKIPQILVFLYTNCYKSQFKSQFKLLCVVSYNKHGSEPTVITVQQQFLQLYMSFCGFFVLISCPWETVRIIVSHLLSLTYVLDRSILGCMFNKLSLLDWAWCLSGLMGDSWTLTISKANWLTISPLATYLEWNVWVLQQFYFSSFEILTHWFLQWLHCKTLTLNTWSVVLTSRHPIPKRETSLWIYVHVEVLLN